MNRHLLVGMRGTGVYAAVLPQPDYRTHFYNCHGTVDLNAGGSKAVS